MESTYHAILALTIIVGSALLWGLRRHSVAKAASAPMPGPGLAGSRLTAARFASPGQEEGIPLLPTLFVRHRVALMRAWGPETPDLQVTAWAAGDGALHLEVQQAMLPLPEDRELILGALERFIVARAMPDSGGEDRLEAFRVGWHLIHLPSMAQTLVVETGRRNGRFRHRLSLLDGDGEQVSLPPGGRTQLLEMMTPGHLAYRNAIADWLEHHEPEAGARHFRQVLEIDRLHGGAWAWLAAVALRSGDEDVGEARRCVAFAEEMWPGSVTARLAAAELRAGGRRSISGRELAAVRPAGLDGSPDAACLIAQALLALDHFAPARQVCEEVLQRSPEHREARNLMELIARREWQAET